MKKIFSIGVLVSLLAIILLPVLLLIHSNHVTNHGGIAGCISHCLESVDGFTEPYNASVITATIIKVVVIIYSKIYEFTLVLTLLYIFVVFPPPNILRYIKNYSYSQLRGIIISTT